MNPPFGTRKKGIDTIFLEAAMKVHFEHLFNFVR